MPIFEFRCCDCGNTFEKLFVKSDEKVDIECPECNCNSLERVVSRTSFTMGAGSNAKKAEITSKSCSPGNKCFTMDLPGPTK